MRQKSALPLGAPVDNTPSDRPGPVTLKGRYGRVEKLSTEHAASLWDAVRGHDAIWTYMSQYGPFAGAEEFAGWVRQRTALADPYSYAIVNNDDLCLGIATLMEIKPAMRVIEVGHIVYSPALQRTPLGTEAQYLLGAMPLRRSATGATSGNAMPSMPPRAAPRYATVSRLRESCAST